MGWDRRKRGDEERKEHLAVLPMYLYCLDVQFRSVFDRQIERDEHKLKVAIDVERGGNTVRIESKRLNEMYPNR